MADKLKIPEGSLTVIVKRKTKPVEISAQIVRWRVNEQKRRLRELEVSKALQEASGQQQLKETIFTSLFTTDDEDT